MTELAEWRIARIEHSYQMVLQPNKEKFGKFTDEWISNLTNRRNDALTLIGFIATSLIGLLSARIMPDIGQYSDRRPHRDFDCLLETTISFPASHVSYVSHPDQIAQLILNATKGIRK